jgi:uncharacterized lipoprotein YmbA
VRSGVSFLLAVAFAIGCAGAAPTPRTQYLMRAAITQGVTPVDAPIAIALGGVDVAPYLSDPGLVLETGARQIHSAHGHVWAEPLNQGLRIYLRARISNELGYSIAADTTTEATPEFVIDIGVDELHGTLSGAARLVAHWRIARFDGSERVVAFHFSGDRLLSQNGYAALVEAEIALVGELAAEIAQSVRNTVHPRAGATSGTDR